MNDIVPLGVSPERVIPEVVTEADMIDIGYERSGLDDLLHDYATSTAKSDLTDDIERALVEYGHSIAGIAFHEGDIDIGLIRHGFGRMYDTMEDAARIKIGPLPTRGPSDFILTKLGIRKPRYMNHFSRLDDRYWKLQFMDEYNKQTWVQRQPNEPEDEFFGRYVATTLHHFPWAHYSYI